MQKPTGYPAIPECFALTYFGISVSAFVSAALSGLAIPYTPYLTELLLVLLHLCPFKDQLDRKINIVYTDICFYLLCGETCDH